MATLVDLVLVPIPEDDGSLAPKILGYGVVPNLHSITSMPLDY